MYIVNSTDPTRTMDKDQDALAWTRTRPMTRKGCSTIHFLGKRFFYLLRKKGQKKGRQRREKRGRARRSPLYGENKGTCMVHRTEEQDEEDEVFVGTFCCCSRSFLPFLSFSWLCVASFPDKATGSTLWKEKRLHYAARSRALVVVSFLQRPLRPVMNNTPVRDCYFCRRVIYVCFF